MAAKAQGAPTKEFFVGMLTRDIELSDAILDLLDNCLDGVVRQKKGIDKTTTSDYQMGARKTVILKNYYFTASV